MKNIVATAMTVGAVAVGLALSPVAQADSMAQQSARFLDYLESQGVRSEGTAELG
jgi:hypothetical protein